MDFNILIPMSKSNPAIEKSEIFAIKCIKVYQDLQKNNEYILSKQFLRSSTSIGANIAEANSSQSKKDFYAKMCIAYKECHETAYWIRLLTLSGLISTDLREVEELCQELIKIIAQIKLTTEKNLSLQKNE